MKIPHFTLTLSFILAALCAITHATTQQEGKMNQEFFNAITQGDAAKVKEMLKADPHLVTVKNDKGMSAVMLATYYRKSEVVAVLLATGVELNIFEAAATGQTERVRVLLKQDKALANTFGADGFAPLSLAVFFGHRETVEALLAGGAEVNAASRETMKVTPLHSAAAARQLEIARILLAHGADVNARQADSGFTPLHEAAANGDLELAKLLLEKGADLNAKMNDGKTPLAFAISRSQPEMAAFLRERGATPAQNITKSETPSSQSKLNRPEDLLKSLVGSWEGAVRTWVHPNKLIDESKVKGRIRPLLDRKFFRHEYTGTMQGKPRHGEETIAFNTMTKRYQVSWVDSFHMHYAIMFSEGEATERGFVVKGKYDVGANAPQWGWKTVFEFVDADHLTITAYNITPDGQEEKAVETMYRRVKPSTPQRQSRR